MTEHRIGTQEEWQAERDELLKEEKELTRRGDELARKRRELPWVPVEKDYRFETEDGTKTLADLFDGRSQLLVYHFMFGPSYEAGCPVCSSIADTLAPQVPHLKARDTTLLLASRAPLEKLLAYRERMGWGIDWVSSGGSDFNRDLGFLYTEEELKPFLEGEIPSDRRAERAHVRDGRRGVRRRGTGPERVRAVGRDRLPDLRDARPAASSPRWPTTPCWTARRRVATRATRGRSGCGATTSTRRASPSDSPARSGRPVDTLRSLADNRLGSLADEGGRCVLESQGQLCGDVFMRSHVPVQLLVRPRCDVRLLPRNARLRHQRGRDRGHGRERPQGRRHR